MRHCYLYELDLNKKSFIITFCTEYELSLMDILLLCTPKNPVFISDTLMFSHTLLDTKWLFTFSYLSLIVIYPKHISFVILFKSHDYCACNFVHAKSIKLTISIGHNKTFVFWSHTWLDCKNMEQQLKEEDIQVFKKR